LENLAVETFAKYGILGMGWLLFLYMFLKYISAVDNYANKYVDLAVKTGITLDGVVRGLEKLDDK
jgi:hypothetical protein